MRKNPNTFHLDHCSFPLRHSSVLKQGCLEQVPTHPVTSDNNFIQLHSNRLASFPSEKPPPNHIACYLVTPYFPFPLLYNSLGKKQTLSTWVHFPSSPYSGLQQGWFKPAPTHLVTSETLSSSYVQSSLPPNGSGLQQGWFKPAPIHLVTSETFSSSYVQSSLPPNGSQPLVCYLDWLKLSISHYLLVGKLIYFNITASWHRQLYISSSSSSSSTKSLSLLVCYLVWPKLSISHDLLVETQSLLHHSFMSLTAVYLLCL